MLTRACAVNRKSVDPRRGYRHGVDARSRSSGDIIEPLRITYRNPLPLICTHDSKKPVRTVVSTADVVRARVYGVASDGRRARTLRDRIDEAWQSIKAGLLAGVSVGFRSIEEGLIKKRAGFAS